MKWWILQVNVMMADKIQKNLALKAENSSEIERVEYIKEEHQSSGKRKQKVMKPIFAGYLVIKTTASEEAREQIAETLVNFKTPRVNLMPLSAEEQLQIVEMLEKPIKKSLSDSFDVDSEVTIHSGPFENFRGRIISINPQKETAKLNIEIFGRPTTTDVELTSLEKVAS